MLWQPTKVTNLRILPRYPLSKSVHTVTMLIPHLCKAIEVSGTNRGLAPPVHFSITKLQKAACVAQNVHITRCLHPGSRRILEIY